jgi:hypothetical protein
MRCARPPWSATAHRLQASNSSTGVAATEATDRAVPEAAVCIELTSGAGAGFVDLIELIEWRPGRRCPRGDESVAVGVLSKRCSKLGKLSFYVKYCLQNRRPLFYKKIIMHVRDVSTRHRYGKLRTDRHGGGRPAAASLQAVCL